MGVGLGGTFLPRGHHGEGWQPCQSSLGDARLCAGTGLWQQPPGEGQGTPWPGDTRGC